MGHTWLELMREPRLETHVAVIETACKAMASSEITWVGRRAEKSKELRLKVTLMFPG